MMKVILLTISIWLTILSCNDAGHTNSPFMNDNWAYSKKFNQNSNDSIYIFEHKSEQNCFISFEEYPLTEKDEIDSIWNVEAIYSSIKVVDGRFVAGDNYYVNRFGSDGTNCYCNNNDSVNFCADLVQILKNNGNVQNINSFFRNAAITAE